MFQNYLKIAWRHLLKNKFISAINFTGLVVGMTAVLFIWQYVAFEKSYDAFHENGDRIFRVRTDRVKEGVTFMQFAAGAACAGPVISRNFPEVEDYVKFARSGDAIYANDENITFKPEKVYYTMPSFFQLFDFALLQGDTSTCLDEPFMACITESTAKKMFGDENAMGKKIIRNGSREYTITGILQDPPPNSHLKYDILLSYITYSDVFFEGGSTETAPYWDGYLTYLLLKPETDWKALEAKIPDVIESTYDKETRDAVEFYLQPFEDIHLTSNFLFETEPPGDEKAVNFLLIIGALVLLIAWFNYVNLATARSEMRAKEVGIRKVVGSKRGSLIRQFLTEAALINVIAILIAFGLTQLLSPWFINLVDKPLQMSIFSNPQLLTMILGVFLLGTFLTGLYPAFLLSSFKPISVLKSGFTKINIAGGSWMRKGLVVFQFIASVALIAGTIIIYNQMQYMQDKKLGIDIEQTLVIKSPIVRDSTFNDKSKTFKKELGQLAAVKSVTGSTAVPGRAYGWTAGVNKWGEEEGEGYSLHAMAADENYTEAYNMQLIAGRGLSKEMGSDASACILNEKGVEVFKVGSPEEAIGLEINFWGDHVKVVGVVKDFHQESPKSIVEPMILRTMNENIQPSYFSLKLSTDKIGSTINQIETTWQGLFADNPLDYFFLDDYYNEQYKAESLFGKVFSLFSGLAIFISCLGLFALVAFVAERKKREIGIRKVLGATVPNIVTLLSKDFLWLVLIGLLIATPLSFYFMDQWLENFASRIDIQWWMMVVAGIAAIAIAFLTIGFQGVKAALANPVDSLRSE